MVKMEVVIWKSRIFKDIKIIDNCTSEFPKYLSNSAGFVYSEAEESVAYSFWQSKNYSWQIEDDPLSDHLKYTPDG